MTDLKRTLGLAECVFFGVGSILGAGVYALIGKVAGHSGHFIWLSFFIAAITAMCTAFSYAELSAMFPKSGGEYEYAKRVFGTGVGNALGVLISLNGIISASVVSIGFAGYLSGMIGVEATLLAFGIAVLIFAVNAMGIRESSTINIVFTLIEISGLIFVIWTAWPSVGSIDYFEMAPGGFGGIVEGSILAFFAYIGFEEIVKLAEETKRPEVTIPKALFISNAIVLVFYSLVAICVVSAIPYEVLGQIDNPLAAVIGSRYGSTGIVIISVIALFATSNTILSNMLGSSRVIYNMAGGIRWLKPLSRLWVRRQTPVLALLLILGVMFAFMAIGKIELVALLATFTIFITFLVVNVCVLVLRVRAPGAVRPFRIPGSVRGWPVISVLGILLTLVLMVYNLVVLVG